MRQTRPETRIMGENRHKNLLPLPAHLHRPDCHYLAYEFMKIKSLHGDEGGKTHVTGISVVGTLGYIAPEYHSTMKFTEKSDVYYGVILGALLVIEKLQSNDLFGTRWRWGWRSCRHKSIDRVEKSRPNDNNAPRHSTDWWEKPRKSVDRLRVPEHKYSNIERAEKMKIPLED
ncbi:hypothetical protein MLD38_021897 [Melastoma candidum]|uniref:Uncharacterized protein n=1 Tax=Melastoma candidum TaxID=119954 RepID=A0ACB9QIQ7_9MYRT|nr:hypothetical protein MLD38_021897 [Melastoma candidum]